MTAARCSVSFTDHDGLLHTARVQAESLFEAVALAVAEFRHDQLVPAPSSNTAFVMHDRRHCFVTHLPFYRCIAASRKL